LKQEAKEEENLWMDLGRKVQRGVGMSSGYSRIVLIITPLHTVAAINA
jgi:hypothetical protein